MLGGGGCVKNFGRLFTFSNLFCIFGCFRLFLDVFRRFGEFLDDLGVFLDVSVDNILGRQN